ncbi:MAG: mitochondrial fusion and transport protein ugo1 [Geoglossum umbratile]|nr:MAG: mitochondrial fusion and transport protein ugo1 [Geoglossum umbratile]
MSSSYSAGRDAPNPLRPYYISPSIGSPPDSNLSPNAPPSHISPSSHGRNAFQPPSKQSFSSARDIFYDLDCSDYLSDASPSVADMARALLDQALWKYTSVLLAQPFDVAKTVLQCQVISGTVAGSHVGRDCRPLHPNERVYIDSDESDPDEPSSYFTPSVPVSSSSHSPPSHTSHRYHTPSRGTSTAPPTTIPPKSSKITLHRQHSLLEVISQLWQKEGAMGVWKGTNTSFIYSVLHKTIECWTRSLLAALLSIPDPGLLPSGVLGSGVLDIADSPSPWASLGIAVAAAGIAGVLLTPLDIVRTRLIMTPTAHPPRSLAPNLRLLPTLSIPPSLLAPTLLHSTLPTLLTTSTPLFLRQKLHLDPILTPTSYSVLTFLSQVAELFVRLPLETVLRRGQVDWVMGSEGGVVTVVDVGPYRGVVGTMWGIVKEEGSLGEVMADTKPSVVAARRRRKGQGMEGLWRGWRVGMWGLVGMWGAATLGGAQGAGQGGEF